MIRFEPVLKQEKPDLVMVFGDVNSTIAASLCAVKMGITVALVEAGLRSFDRTMPEEWNRIVTDHLSEYLFITEPSAQKNLLKEGLPEEKIFFVGNVMVDTLLKHRERAQKLNFAKKLGLPLRGYALLTLHRPSNVDDPETLANILDAVWEIGKRLPIVFPCHPRTQVQLPALAERLPWLKRDEMSNERRVIITEPLGYLEFLSLMDSARLVLADSGGIQEETTVLNVPCLTVRENTERPITVEQGTNILVGNRRDRLLAAAEKVLSEGEHEGRIPELWDGHAAERIAGILTNR